MRSDPRIGYGISLAIAGLSAVWLLALLGYSDPLYDRLGSAMHAVTFIAIFLLITGLIVSRLFASFLAIRNDLASGRDVLGRWQVDQSTWREFAGPAESMERADKLSLLGLVYFFIVLVCGSLALAIPQDAHIFGYIALGMATLVTFAFLLGTRIYASQLRYRSGEIIVGRRGVSVDGVLHVWDNWLSWPEGAEVIERPVPMLLVGYGYWARYGPQNVSVRMPVMARDLDTARKAAEQLNALAGCGNAQRRRAGARTRRKQEEAS